MLQGNILDKLYITAKEFLTLNAQRDYLPLLLQRLDGLGIPYGREDSFKCVPDEVISDRVLIGVNVGTNSAENLFSIAVENGLPASGLAALVPYAAVANAVFFGFERSGATQVCKLYVELWDQVRRQVRLTGANAPLLMHLGVKWDPARPDRHVLARYDCHPMLGTAAILRRMALCYPSATEVHEAARDIVAVAAERNPDASMLYLEVSEEGNPRRSFDIKLYKARMRVNDAAAQVRLAARALRIPDHLLERELQRLGPCPLGHLSSGIDRHGRPFLSIYAETLAVRDGAITAP